MIKYQIKKKEKILIEKRDNFIGGAWPYANYYLHVGHLAALLPVDILAKYFRGKGDYQIKNLQVLYNKIDEKSIFDDEFSPLESKGITKKNNYN